MTCVAVINGKKVLEKDLKNYSIKSPVITQIMDDVNKRVNEEYQKEISTIKKVG